MPTEDEERARADEKARAEWFDKMMRKALKQDNPFRGEITQTQQAKVFKALDAHAASQEKKAARLRRYGKDLFDED